VLGGALSYAGLLLVHTWREDEEKTLTLLNYNRPKTINITCLKDIPS
jgi:hypothetical protein